MGPQKIALCPQESWAAAGYPPIPLPGSVTVIAPCGEMGYQQVGIIIPSVAIHVDPLRIIDQRLQIARQAEYMGGAGLEPVSCTTDYLSVHAGKHPTECGLCGDEVRLDCMSCRLAEVVVNAAGARVALGRVLQSTLRRCRLLFLHAREVLLVSHMRGRVFQGEFGPLWEEMGSEKGGGANI